MAAMARSLLLGLALAVGGCREARRVDPGELREAAGPHVEAFVRFDAWARRTFAADTQMRDAARLEETLFAPIRRADAVAGAWVRRQGVGPQAFAMGPEATPPEVERWVALPAAEVDHLRTTYARMTVRRGRAPREVEVLLIARRRPSGVASQVEVVVAFLTGPAGSD